MSTIPSFSLSRRLLSLSAARRTIGTTTIASSNRRATQSPLSSASSPPLLRRQPPTFNGGPASIRHQSRTIASTTRRGMLAAAVPTGREIISSVFDSREGAALVGTDVEGAVEALAKADAVCFDVDSTVIDEEGIDVLAASLGKGEEVAAWTLKAMEGDTKFEDALAARLDIIRPSRSDIRACLQSTPLQISPGIDDLIASLQSRGTAVYLISGGFRIMIEPVAAQLSVPPTNIIANTILFDDDGNYAGFDSKEPTSADMGKSRAVGMIKAEHGYETVVMVGDGATDMQAKPPADMFIGYGGVAVRDAVRDGACWFVTDFDGMIDIVRRYGGQP